MRIAVITDVHANLPALQAALSVIRVEGCDAVYHMGDAIAIGPHPAECMDLLLSAPNVHPIMGNHDAWFAYGLPKPQPWWMNDGEVVHQRWVHAQLDPSLRSVVTQWPYVVQETFEGVRVALLHYEPAATASGFASFRRDYGPSDLDRVFGRHKADIVLYGHTHIASNVSGRARYVNPGSLGCHREAVARFIVLECIKGRYALEKRAVPYDDRALLEAFKERRVPERAFLYRAFFGGRYGSGQTQ